MLQADPLASSSHDVSECDIMYAFAIGPRVDAEPESLSYWSGPPKENTSAEGCVHAGVAPVSSARLACGTRTSKGLLRRRLTGTISSSDVGPPGEASVAWLAGLEISSAAAVAASAVDMETGPPAAAASQEPRAVLVGTRRRGEGPLAYLEDVGVDAALPSSSRSRKWLTRRSALILRLRPTRPARCGSSRS